MVANYSVLAYLFSPPRHLEKSICHDHVLGGVTTILESKDLARRLAGATRLLSHARP